jgi:hypothetical protein
MYNVSVELTVTMFEPKNPIVSVVMSGWTKSLLLDMIVWAIDGSAQTSRLSPVVTTTKTGPSFSWIAAFSLNSQPQMLSSTVANIGVGRMKRRIGRRGTENMDQNT